MQVVIGGWRGPGWQVTDADPAQGRRVREWIKSAVARHGCPVDPDDVALAVAELFGNAVMHGPAGGRVLAGYCLWHEGARILVCDGGGAGPPRVVHGAGLAEGGRGLRVVDALAVRWGSFRLPGALVVWCDFGRPLRAPAADAWAWLPPVLAACPLSPAALSQAALSQAALSQAALSQAALQAAAGSAAAAAGALAAAGAR
jgi:serine/threonine-protein kinase RsbW